MYRRIRSYLGRIPLVAYAYRALSKAKYELTDIRDSYLSKSTKLKQTPYGFSLVGSTSVHHLAMQEGTFEPEEALLFNEHLLDADVFVDVGANIGFYACIARLADKHVVAVEPLPKNLKYLYTNFMANDWNDVEVFPVGLSNHAGLATLYGASSTGASLIGSWAGATQLFRRIIPISTLDILLGTRFVGKTLLIKIDVEGVEYPVLLGSSNILCMQPKPTWMVEICFNEYHPDGMNPNFENIFNLFWENGYEARTADQRSALIQRADIERWVKCSHCDSGTINYLFIPNG